MSELEKLRKTLTEAMADALRVYETNRDRGAPPQSVAFDSGRYDGLKQAIELLDSAVEIAHR